MKSLEEKGISVISLDVTDEDSIVNCENTLNISVKCQKGYRDDSCKV